MFNYSSKEAYNSCLSMFPVMAANQGHNTTTFANILEKSEAKKNRIEEFKRNRAYMRAHPVILKSTLPTLNIETQGDIVQDKNLYVDEAPTYRASFNSKIRFQSQRQPEFEVNPDIDALHQMFPSLSLDLIYSKYLACEESLNSTIDELLLVPAESTDMDTQNPEQWPSICSSHVESGSSAVCFSEDMSGERGGDTSTAHHHATTPLRSAGSHVEHPDSHCNFSSDSDSDMVLVGTRGNSISDFMSESTCEDDWLVVSELGEGGGFVVMNCDKDERCGKKATGTISYKDMLLHQQA
mmetsp:Transcript_20975/g.39053  ORF Transcript_20975/g.39053 Transcript_20975/m.39053 type:complete len:296 (-) Transcript_20975:126-1013(-)